MAVVTYDRHSFMVDGNRVWLVSGELHYFRIPAGLWRDRLLKAKRAGLNCITTYVAWNFHEPQEGKWDFTGDRDIAAFIRLAGELGLYVILRPGPYICAEWDFGGLPAWLTTKSGIAYRTSNATYTHYFDKYFRQLLPRLADLQVTRSGPIILIQNENEYHYTAVPDRANHLDFISQLIRRGGFDIPIVTCNWWTPIVEGAVDCINGYGNELADAKRMRRLQPDAPLVSTEFWDGFFDWWGNPHFQRPPAEVVRKMLEFTGAGCQVNYYMYHGGTNFAFWASRLNMDDHSYQTTSYDYGAPIAEGGGLTRMYYLSRLVNVMAGSFSRFLLGATLEQGAHMKNQPTVMNLTGPNGRFATISNMGKADVTTAEVSLPNGQLITVQLDPLGAIMIPIELRVSPQTIIDYSTLMPLGLFHADKVLVLHGMPGQAGKVSVNGAELEVTVPEGDEVKLVEHQGLSVVVINTELATRTWPLDEGLVFGPTFVGETLDDAVCDEQFSVLSKENKLTRRKPKAAAKKLPASIALRFKRSHQCTETQVEGLPWQPIPKPPADHDTLGACYGYVWYRIRLEEAKARTRNLFLPGFEDRARLFLNGKFLGTWGRGDDATRTPMPASLKAGVNELVVLSDNMGRPNYGSRIGQRKGLVDHVYDARPLRMAKPKIVREETFAPRLVPRALTHLTPQLSRLPLWSVTWNVSLSKVAPIHLAFTNCGPYITVLCNTRQCGFFESVNKNYGDVTLGPELNKGANTITVLAWGEPKNADPANFQFFSLDEAVSQGKEWSWRQWTPPHGAPTRPSRAAGVVAPQKHAPAWFSTEFKLASHGAHGAHSVSHSASAAGARGAGAQSANGNGAVHATAEPPLFLEIAGAVKGQIYLNGNNVGRYWTVGPQNYYYLPQPWLAQDNELLLFEETGLAPTSCRLVYRPQGPYEELPVAKD